jgi:hypothetical protein
MERWGNADKRWGNGGGNAVGEPTAVDESVSRGRAVLTLSTTMSIGYIRGNNMRNIFG